MNLFWKTWIFWKEKEREWKQNKDNQKKFLEEAVMEALIFEDFKALYVTITSESNKE